MTPLDPTDRPTSLPDPTRSSRALPRLGPAERELREVHRREVAQLLRRAAAVRAYASGSSPSSRFPTLPESRRGWARSARTALRLFELDGWRPRGARVLGALVESEIADWPSAVSLARQAHRVEASSASEICLGFALLSAGEAAEAEERFSGLLADSALGADRWRAWEGLALAHEALDRPHLAAGAAEAAAEDPRSGLSVLVQGLYLALANGEESAARRAAARLDMLADPFSPEFSSALGHLRSRLAGRGVLPWNPMTSTRRLFRELLREGQSAAGRVCSVLT